MTASSSRSAKHFEYQLRTEIDQLKPTEMTSLTKSLFGSNYQMLPGLMIEKQTGSL